MIVSLAAAIHSRKTAVKFDIESWSCANSIINSSCWATGNGSRNITNFCRKTSTGYYHSVSCSNNNSYDCHYNDNNNQQTCSAAQLSLLPIQ